MDEWIVITPENVNQISAMDLRAEAGDCLAEGRQAKYRKSSKTPQHEVLFVEDYERAGIACNANAQWGDTETEIDEDGTINRFRVWIFDGMNRLTLDENGDVRCCYFKCDNIAQEEFIDAEGDWCCAEHCAKGESYVEFVVDGDDSNVLSDEGIAGRFEDAMQELGWDVVVMRCESGRAPGTYMRRGGDYQILGYSMKVPESYRLDWDRVVNKLL